MGDQQFAIRYNCLLNAVFSKFFFIYIIYYNEITWLKHYIIVVWLHGWTITSSFHTGDFLIVGYSIESDNYVSIISGSLCIFNPGSSFTNSAAFIHVPILSAVYDVLDKNR